MIKNRRKKQYLLRILIPILAVAVLLFFFTALSNLSRDRGDEGRVRLETALRRAAVACYASEGVYPPTADYLVQHYGVQIDHERYTVFYEIFADNIMPDITVLEK